VKAHRLVS